MIILEDRKIAIVCVPRTGTNTLRQIFSNGIDNHLSVPQFKERYPEIDIDSFTIYGFYRDPVERFISLLNYALMNSPEIDPNIGIREFVEQYGSFVPQARWLDYPGIRLLPFDKLEEGIRELMPELLTVPVLNESTGRTFTDLSGEDRLYVRDKFQVDYDLFANKF